MELVTYNKEQLGKLIISNHFKDFQFLPITIHRTLSQIKNPRANEKDTLLILAFEEDRLAGYIGVLPDTIFHQEKVYHFGWLSTLFIHPDFRGKKIAQKLLAKACEMYEEKIMITEFTPEAENMYVRSNLFDYEKTLLGKTYHYFFNLAEKLPQKNQKWELLTSFLKITDFTANIFLTFIYKISNRSKNFSHPSEYLDEESMKFINDNIISDIFKKKLEDIIWFTSNPWILKNEKQQTNYQFSSYEKDFKYIFLKIYENHQLSNILILLVRNFEAKLIFIIGTNNLNLCSDVLYHYITNYKILSIIIFDEFFIDVFEKKASLFKKERLRKYLIHKNLKDILGENFIFKGSASDGDTIFT